MASAQCLLLGVSEALPLWGGWVGAFPGGLRCHPFKRG